MAVGTVVPVVLGAVFGLGLRPATQNLAVRPMAAGEINVPDQSRVVVEEVVGEVWADWGTPGWRRIRVGDEVRRPVTLRTRGVDGYVRVGIKGGRLAATHNALIRVGAAGSGLAFTVDRGLALVHRASQPVQVLVPANGVDVTGNTFGVWVRPQGGTTVAALGDVAKVRIRDATEEVGPGKEVLIRRGRVDTSEIPRELSVDLTTKRRVRGRTRIAARTSSDNAMVLAFGRGGYKKVELNRGGTFAVELPDDLPGQGTLIALDAVGRWAELDRPSRNLEQVLQDLKSGAPRPSHVLPDDRGRIAEGDDRTRRRKRRRRRSREAVDTAEERTGRGATDGKPRRRKRGKSGAKPPSIEDAVADEDEVDERAL